MSSTAAERATYTAIIESAIAEAKAQGATAAEASVGVETGLSVSVRMGDVETLEYHHDKGLGVTIYIGNSKGSANTSDLSADAIRAAVRAACGIARHTAADQYSGIADRDLLAWEYPDLDLCHPWAVTAEQAVELALECEGVARGFDPRIVNTEGASVSTHQGFHVYGNSHGFVGGYPSSRHSLSCTVIGEDANGGMQRDYWYTTSRRSSEMESAEAVGKRAAERTVARLNARRLPTGQVPVLFTSEVASGLIGHFLRAVGGGSLYRKTTFLLDSLNTQVFPDWLHMYEEPHIRGALGSAPFDGDGVATHAHDLVRDGVVKSYILDVYAARRLGMRTTGNAGGVHNLTVSGGDLDRDALIKQMNRGLVITELMGQGVNGVTGDYSRGASGFWVENGEIQFPVEEITVAGNLKDMYKNIVAVGNDIDPRRSMKVGSILLDKMTVAGE